MDTVSIRSPKALSVRDLEHVLAARWRVSITADGGLAVHGDRGRAYLENSDEGDPFFAGDPGCPYVLLDYSDVELAKETLTIVADDPNLVVDNDFGTVLPGNQFVERMRIKKSGGTGGGHNWETGSGSGIVSEIAVVCHVI